MKYIISVGTNLGDRRKNVEKAIEAINLLPYTEVSKASHLYETEPVGYARQDNFYNITLLVDSVLEPNEMLGACLGIESAFGRIRAIPFGPRIIDLDVIFAEDIVVDSKNFTVPHPRYKERRFVLEPMLDIFPDGIVFGKDIKPYLERVKEQELICLE